MKKRGWLDLEPELGDLKLSEDDVLGELANSSALDRLFGRIHLDQFYQDLEERGLLDRLRRRGYVRFWAEVQRPDARVERVLLWANHPDRSEPLILMDVKSRQGRLGTPWGLSYRVLVWEWIEMRDPLARPSAYRPAFPGQTAPGLGLFHSLTKLMLQYVEELDLEALAAVPEYFHNAVLYASHFRFLEAAFQGEFQAMCRDLLHQGLAPASWWMARGEVDRVQKASGEVVPYSWTPHTIVRPLEPGLRARLTEGDYPSAADAAMQEVEFRRREMLDSDAQPAL